MIFSNIGRNLNGTQNELRNALIEISAEKVQRECVKGESNDILTLLHFGTVHKID